jgi:hypothetical protein
MTHSNRNPVDPDAPKRAAIVVSNPAVSTSTGWPGEVARQILEAVGR